MRCVARTVHVLLGAGLCGLLAGPLAAQDTYSYKRPSPTTVTSFQSLFDMCVADGTTRSAASQHSLCVGYFTGLVDLYLSETPAAQRRVCLPTDPPLTRQQGRDKLVAWADANPGAGSQPAAVGVMQFLETSFPCPAQSSR